MNPSRNEMVAVCVLLDAKTRCPHEDMQSAEVFAAMQTLRPRAHFARPFEEFWQTLRLPKGETADAEQRREKAHAALTVLLRAAGFLPD